MRQVLTALMVTGVLMVLAAPAAADWNPGDGHKMHFPQMPDPQGWDANFTLHGFGAQLAVADDWQCIQSGPVSDIHFWLSSRGDLAPLTGDLLVQIFDDIPAAQSGPGYSIPGERRWQHLFTPGQFSIGQWGNGDQGWFDPARETPEILPQDHHTIYQANLDNIPNPFFQEQGKIYWLALTVFRRIEDNEQPATASLGWKTSLDHWNDAAVFNYAPAIGPPSWQRLEVFVTGPPLDLAFVITPEPGTWAMLMGAGALALLACARRNRGRK